MTASFSVSDSGRDEPSQQRPEHETASRDDRSGARPVLVCFFLGVPVLAALYAFGYGWLPRTAAIVVISILLASAGSLIAFLTSARQTLSSAIANLQLGPWYGLSFSLLYGISSLVHIGEVQAYPIQFTTQQLSLAAVVSGMGVLALGLAYTCTPMHLSRVFSSIDSIVSGDSKFRTGTSSIWVLWSIATVSYIVQLRLGNFGYLSNPVAALQVNSSLPLIISALTQLGILATFLAAHRYAVRRSGRRLLLLSLIAGSGAMVGAFSGTKQAILVHLVAIVIGLSQAKGRIRLIPVLVAGLIAALIVTPFITGYRAAVIESGGRLTPSQALNSIDFTNLVQRSVGGQSGAVSISQLAERESRIGDVAIITSQTPATIPYEPRSDLVEGPILGVIPRSVWANKPVLDAGYQVYIHYYHAPTWVHNSAAVTPYGDLWRHGGWVPLFLGMGVLGWFLRCVDARTELRLQRGRGRQPDPRGLFLPLLLFVPFIKQEMDYVALTASLISIILSAALAYRLTGSRHVAKTSATPSN